MTWQIFRQSRWRAFTIGLAGVVSVLLLTAAGYRLHLDFATVSPLFILAVVLESLSGSFFWSAFVSVLAVGCLDYFFVAPVFSFAVSGNLNIIALASYLGTSLVITQLVTRVRKASLISALQKERIERLYTVAQQLLALEPEGAAGPLLQPFLGVFGIRAACIVDAETNEGQALGESLANLGERTRAALLQHRDADDPAAQVTVRLLKAGGTITGAMGFEGLEDPALTAGPLISLAAVSQERTRAFRSVSAAAAATQIEMYRSAIVDALAHEFKTPLSIILAAAGGIREIGSLMPGQNEMAEAVELEAARLNNLTSRLLSVARLDREDVKPQFETTDVAALVGELVNRYTRLPTDRQISFWRAAEPAEASADPELLGIAVTQLLENAIKYSVAGSEIKLEAKSEDGLVAIRISNRGSISPADQERIFERFYRGAEAKCFSAGSGLGLYVARKIAAAHGGTLELEPQPPNQPVTFRLTIPNAAN